MVTESFEERRRHERESYTDAMYFTVLCKQTSEFERIHSSGEIIDASKSGVGIITDFPLQPGHILGWDERPGKGKLHIALVKWSREDGSSYRAGLMFI